MRSLTISFSGGETSAYMAQRLLGDKKLLDKYSKVSVLFANTGEEHEETLIFVQRCSEYFGFDVVWLESVVNPEKGKGTKHKVVDFESASRNGEPFESVIKKYGLSNPIRRYCTRELKQMPLDSWRKSNGFSDNTDTAIGIRYDEFDRASSRAQELGLIYPLIDWQIQKADVNCFWQSMPFRLNLKGYEGNCKTCYKKSDRKLGTIALYHPEWFDNFERWEREYEDFIPENQNVTPPIRIFRGNRTVADIKNIPNQPGFIPATDDKQHTVAIIQGTLFDMTTDIDGGCSESCEAY